MLEQENNYEAENANNHPVVNQTEMETVETSIDLLNNDTEKSVTEITSSDVQIPEKSIEPENIMTGIDLIPDVSLHSNENPQDSVVITDNSATMGLTSDLKIKKPVKRTKKLKVDTDSESENTEPIATSIEIAPARQKKIKNSLAENLHPTEPLLLLPHEEEEEDEETKMIEEEEAINLDYSAYTKEQLLNMAIEAPKNQVAREAVKKIQNIRPFFDDLLKLERQEQLQKYLEAGHEEETFEYQDDGSKVKFYDAFKLAQEARAEEKKRIEDEKLKNLATKNALIERIKILTESDETVDSLNEIKQLQNEWKAIRVIPKPNLQELYDRYHFYLDKFYDNLAINRELKELDRQKNLGIKIDLCNKADALQKEPSLKRAFIMLAKYQEEFKNTGPVPREFSEEIWSRFKSTIDEIYKQRKAQFDTIQEKRVENLKLKEVLVEKARLIANHIPSKGSEWKTYFDELNKLMDEWKAIGQVPKAQNESIWHQFRDQFNIFSKNRNEQFKKLNAERKSNISVKEDICRRAEELKDSEDYIFTTKEFIKLQEEWKNSGSVPDSVSQAVWKRFRLACDDFFNRKQLYFENRKGEEGENLRKKREIIAEMEELQKNDDGDEVLSKLKEVQSRWVEIGFVPLKNKKDIGDKYHLLLDTIYKKFRQNRDSYKRAHLNQHYNQIASQPGGDKKLGDDERRLREKIKVLKTEIETWENNIEFFARSKNAEKFRKDIEDKIAKVNGQIAGMTNELNALRAAKTEKV